MRERFARFMQGRYGIDTFSRVLLVAGLVLLLFSNFISRGFIRSLIVGLSWALLIYSYVRMFSRNVTKRYAENQEFLRRTAGIRGYFSKLRNQMKERRVYHIYTCPNCKQKIRIPKGKGKIQVRCPKCSTTFIKNS